MPTLRIGKLTLYGLIAAVAAWLAGLVWFAGTLPNARDIAALGPGDGIVVLTGGTGRLTAGLDLLAARKGQRLLVSGVHPTVTKADLASLTGTDIATFLCCVDFDHASVNTRDNARESAAWAEAKGYRTLYLVTSDYHIDRSLLLFEAAMPERTIVPFPVPTEISAGGLTKEYSKTVVAFLRQMVGL